MNELTNQLLAALHTADRTFAENGLLASHAARQEIRAALAAQPGAVGEQQFPEVMSQRLEMHFRHRIGVYADQHPTLLVRQLAKLLRSAWSDAAAPTEAKPATQQASGGRDHMAGVEIFRLDANINGVDHQLVDFVRYEDHARVVHNLETICDPAGLVRENAQLRDTNEGLQRMYRAALSPAQQDAVDADSLAEFFALHAAELEDNPYAYCEVAYTRATGWMAWITDKPLCAVVVAPDRKVLTSGQGDTPAEAARAAISAKKGG